MSIKIGGNYTFTPHFLKRDNDNPKYRGVITEISWNHRWFRVTCQCGGCKFNECFKFKGRPL